MKCERKTLAEVYILSIYTHADAHTLKPHIDTYKSADTPSARVGSCGGECVRACLCVCTSKEHEFCGYVYAVAGNGRNFKNL